MSLRVAGCLFAVSSMGFLCGCSAGEDGSSASGASAAGGTGGSTAAGTGGTGGSGVGAGGLPPGTGNGPSLGMGGSEPKDDKDCDSTLEVVYRDFNESHPDFEMPFAGDVVRLQLVEATLGVDKKPVFRDSIGCPPDHDDPRVCGDWFPTEPVIQSAETFDQWYRTLADVNVEFQRTIELAEETTGTYVFDSADFFPLGPAEGYGVTPANHHLGKNYLFTTEIHVNFTYLRGQRFTFRGDDDLWIFVNNKLAMDLGSMHLPAEGTIDFDALAAELGIVSGQPYPMDIFHAERHTTGSNFRFETNISCFTPVVVK